MTTPSPAPNPLDALSPELRVVRAADTALDLEPHVGRLSGLAALGVVQARICGGTTLGLAEAVMSVVEEAARRLNPERPEHALAQRLFRVHPATAHLDPIKARKRTQEARGLTARQFRAREEPRLCRLVAQAILELQAEWDAAAAAQPKAHPAAPKVGTQPLGPNTEASPDTGGVPSE